MPSIGSEGRSGPVLSWLAVLLTLAQLQTTRGGFACLGNPCVHGVCIDDLNSTYSCYCIDGYTGVRCQTNWDECWSSPCQNGGICVDGIAMFNCSCPPGFVGDVCEENFNECESNPCQNNGTCIDATNGYLCSCLTGYSGTHCEVDVAVCNSTNETRCANGGVCVEGPGDTFSCTCRPGWTGFFCDMEMNECLSAPCMNGGVCIDLHADYACACLFGYTGRNCEESVATCEKNPCRNGALCLIEDRRTVCYCVPDYHGDLCQYQYDECQLGPRCMNGGTCIDGVDNFTCSCPTNLTGVLCECLILGENNYDCTYVSPTPSSFSTSSTTSERTAMTQTITAANTTSELTTATTVPTIYPNSITSLPAITESTTMSETLPNTTLDTTMTTYTTELTTSELTTLTSTSTETFSPSTTTQLTTMFTTSEPTDITMITSEVPTSTESTTTEKTLPPTDSTLPTLTPSEKPTTVQTTTEEASTTVYATVVPYQNATASPRTEPTMPVTTETSKLTTAEIVTTVPPTEVPTPSSTTSTVSATSSTSASVTPTSFFTEKPVTSTEMYTTTMSTESMTPTEGTTMAPIDCTKSGTRCRNGGTCLFESGRYKCQCPFDTEGIFCEINLGIRKAAFNGESYLSHRLTNVSDIRLEFKAKTFASNGLLFYSNVDSTYMALYIRDGYLQFKFSCGYQTMLLSELSMPVNNGYEMTVKAELDFSKDFKHCDASISVNDSLTMTGDQTAVVNKLVKPAAWLHLGGVPQAHHIENLPDNGFIGCMTDLKMSAKKINIFKDAEDGSEVTECASFACLSSPCQNGASCVSLRDTWHCNCKDGYTGQMCEMNVCDNNPCLFGGTCVPFSGTGYICLCPLGKHGHFCESDLKVAEPNFSSSIRGLSSYVAYPIPDGISETMEMSFKFVPTTMDQISILMFIGQKGQHDSHSDHMAVSFVKGYIMLTWNLGSGPRRIFTNQPIEEGPKEYVVRLGHFGRRAWLHVDMLGNVTGRTPGNLVQLDVVPLIYFGGHDSLNFSTLPHDLPLHTGFSGCIYDVKLKSGSVLVPLQGSREAVGRSVGQCGTTECYERRCQNDGACLHHGSTFMCLCQDKWFGPMCTWPFNPCDSTRHRCASGSTCVPTLMDYECDCPFGRTGKYCEKEENITDVSLTGRRSYLSLAPIKVDTNRFDLDLEIRTLNTDGLLVFIGRRDFCYLSLFLESGLLELRIVTGRKKGETDPPLIIRSTKLLVIGVWHRVLVGIFGRKVYLSVDKQINTGLLAAGSTLSISKDNIFVGGLPDMSLLPPVATASLPLSFTGCVRKFTVNYRHVALSTGTVLAGRNAMDCDGTPCGGDACDNGGTCFLDASMRPRCLCPQPYYGVRCELVPSCSQFSCRNDGECHDAACSCRLGYRGTFCENEITVQTPQFSGGSYLGVKRVADKKRETRNQELGGLFVNFTTASGDGLLVWSRKEKNFVGVGMENGRLKLAYSVGKAHKNFIEIPSPEYVSDGLWHSLNISFAPLIMVLDDRPSKIFNKYEKFTNNLPLISGGILYIGGVPSNTTVFDETHGIFADGFVGCIDGFVTSQGNLLTDTKNLEGTNIDTCDISKQ